MFSGANSDVRERSSNGGARGSSAAVLQEATQGVPDLGGDEAEGGDGTDPTRGVWTRGAGEAEVNKLFLRTTLAPVQLPARSFL